MKKLISLTIINILLGLPVLAQTSSQLKKEFQSLGDNNEALERIKKMESQQKIRIVQSRLVDRENRIELDLGYGSFFGGDSYVKSSNLTGRLEYHLNPRWSFGAEYSKFYNSLTNEGQKQYDSALACQTNDTNCQLRFPGVDFSLETKTAIISFYPIYGKLNLFDLKLAQFDIYTLLGLGQKTLSTGATTSYLAGLGVGVWLNNLFTTRFELRAENYNDLLANQKRNQTVVSAVAQIGLFIW